MNLEERRKFIQDKDTERKLNREKVSKKFHFKNGVEESNFEMIQEYNGISFNISRKAYNQVRGKESSFCLDKKEVEAMRDYLSQALENWDEWNNLEK